MFNVIICDTKNNISYRVWSALRFANVYSPISSIAFSSRILKIKLRFSIGLLHHIYKINKDLGGTA
jgi:hypothetical protein